jgi:regulation of enolase protein 1 (concanavalin A-like superfamily)
LTIRLTAEPGQNAKVHIEYKNGNKWVVFREITGWIFERDKNMDVGVMACSPGKSSFRAEFWDIMAQDYSELAYQKGLPYGAVNPNLNPDAIVGS